MDEQKRQERNEEGRHYHYTDPMRNVITSPNSFSESILSIVYFYTIIAVLTLVTHLIVKSALGWRDDVPTLGVGFLVASYAAVFIHIVTWDSEKMKKKIRSAGSSFGRDKTPR